MCQYAGDKKPKNAPKDPLGLVGELTALPQTSHMDLMSSGRYKRWRMGKDMRGRGQGKERRYGRRRGQDGGGEGEWKGRGKSRPTVISKSRHICISLRCHTAVNVRSWSCV